MKIYKLPIKLYEPSEDTNDMYMAEVPALPGCYAWGETASEALECVKGNAEAFIESYEERGVPLPEKVDVPGCWQVGLRYPRRDNGFGMTYRELTRKLKRLGCEYDHHGKGSHEIWINVATDATTSIPNWRARDLKPGTIAAILRAPGISRDDFDRA